MFTELSSSLTVKTAPVQVKRQCLAIDSQLATNRAESQFITVQAIREKMSHGQAVNLQSSSDSDEKDVRVTECRILPSKERDFMGLGVEDVAFNHLTSDHLIEVSKGGNPFNLTAAGELRQNDFVRTPDGVLAISRASLIPRVAKEVVELILERPATIWLRVAHYSDLSVSIYGCMPEPLLPEGDMIYVAPPSKFQKKRPFSDPGDLRPRLPSKGSQGHPDKCGGFCHQFTRFGKCALEADCPHCHIQGCQRKKRSKKQREKYRNQTDAT